MWAHYPSTLPFLERTWKQCRHGWWWLKQFIQQGKRPPVVFVWPDMPSRRTALHKISRELGWELTNKARSTALLGIKFEDTTHKLSGAIPVSLSNVTAFWNASCHDISKGHLERQHQAAFGYGMRIDPTKHQGPLVVKSEENAKHDGALIHGPISSDEVQQGVVYQREIDNRDESGHHFDFRVVYIRDAIPVVYKKYKKQSERFTNETSRVELLEASPFTSDEESRMLRLARAMQVDYAEFDALRDRNSGQLYVVDVNPTPWGPPVELPLDEQKEAVSRMAKCLRSSL
jgi:hypothetical protein